MIAGVTLGGVTHRLDKVQVELAGSRESTQTTYLLGFSSGIARAVRAEPSIRQSRECTGTVPPTCERSRHQCCRCYRAWLVGLKSDQRYPSAGPLYLVQ